MVIAIGAIALTSAATRVATVATNDLCSPEKGRRFQCRKRQEAGRPSRQSYIFTLYLYYSILHRVTVTCLLKYFAFLFNNLTQISAL